MTKHFIFIFILSLLITFLVTYVLGMYGQELSTYIYVTFIRGLAITIIASVLTGIPAGIYWVTKKEIIPKLNYILWGCWCLVVISTTVERYMLMQLF